MLPSLKIAEPIQFLWLYKLSESELKNVDLYHNLFAITDQDKHQIKLNIHSISKQLPYLENICIFQPCNDIALVDRFYIEQFHDESNAYGEDRKYYTNEYNRTEHGKFLWHFEIKRNEKYHIDKDPVGKVVQGDNQKILGFLYSIFWIEDSFHMPNLLVDFLDKLLNFEDLKLDQEKIKEFFEILHYAPRKRFEQEFMRNLLWILALGILPNSLNLSRSTVTALKDMKIDLLKQENEKEILNLKIDQHLQKFFLKGLSVLVSLKSQLDEDEFIGFLIKLKEYTGFQTHLVNDLKLSNFKFDRMSFKTLRENRYFADKSPEKINLLIFLLGSFSDPLEIMSVIGHFMDLFYPRINEEPRDFQDTENQKLYQTKLNQGKKNKIVSIKIQEPKEDKIPGFSDSEEEKKRKLNSWEENFIDSSTQREEFVMSKEDEEALLNYLKHRILYTKLPKNRIPEALSLYSSLQQKMPETVQSIFFNWINICSNPEIEEIIRYTVMDICNILPTLSDLKKILVEKIFDVTIDQCIKSKLKYRQNSARAPDYRDDFKILLLSELIFPAGSIDIVQDLLRLSAANKDDIEYLIFELFVPHESKISHEAFAKELKSVIKFFVKELSLSFDMSWQNKIILQIIKLLNPDSALRKIAVREYLANYHSKYSVKEVLRLLNYYLLFDQDIFLTEYAAYVNDRVFSEMKARNRQEKVIKNKKDGEEELNGEKKNMESGIKEYVELLKPSNADASQIYDLKIKLLKMLLNLLDADQIDLMLQSVLFEDPRADHIWYIMLEIASMAGFNYKEIKVLDRIVTTLYQVLQNLSKKNTDMQTASKLCKVTENWQKERVFISYLDQAQKIKKNKEMIDARKALKSIVKTYQDCLKKYQYFDTYIKAVANIASDGKTLVEAYSKLSKEFDKTIVKDFEFPQELMQHAEIVITFSEYSASLCYKNCHSVLVSQLNKNLEDISIKEYNATIMKAEDRCLELKYKLQEYSQLKIAEIQILFGGINDPNREIEALKNLKLILDEEIAESLEDFLKKFQVKEQIKKLCQYLLVLFKIFNIPKGELSSHSQKYLKMLEEQDTLIVENFSSLSNKMETINAILKNEVLFIMIKEIAGAEELIEFLESLHEKDIKTMLDGLDEYGESLLRAQSIVELNIVKQFICKFDKSTELGLLESMKDLIQIQQQTFKGIEKFIASCKSEISSIKNLHSQFTSREQANKTKITDIVKNSVISIKYESISDHSPPHEYVITILPNKNRLLSVSLSEATDLRDRTLLRVSKEKNMEALMENNSQEGTNFMSRENQKQEEQIIEKKSTTENYLKIFVEITEMLISIQLNLSKLYETGYPEIFERRSIMIEKGRTEKLQEFKSNIKHKLDVWKENIKQCVKNSSILSNFYGQQYWILEELFLSDCNEEDRLRGLNILRYVNPKISLKEVQSFIDEDKGALGSSPKERLEKLGLKLSKLFAQVGEVPKLEIPIKYEHRYNFGQGRILLTKSIDKFSIVEKVLAIYAKPIDCSQYPTSNQILFCSEHTSWENLRSFLFLIFADTTGSIYTLANADKLRFSLKSQLTQTFKELYDEQEKPKFRLAIICTDSDSQLYAHFMQYSAAFNIKDNVDLSTDEIKELLAKWDVNATTITSHRSGLGKTHLIKSSTDGAGEFLVSFIISGNVNLASYAQRLCSNPAFRSDQAKIALHLDISTVNDSAEVNEFLFMIICLRAFKVQNEAFICDKNVLIYVEIANTWSDKLKISLPFCNYLKQKFIDKLDLNNIDPEKSSQNPIQRACIYLLLLEEAPDKRKPIDYTEINIAENKNPVVLQPKICAQLLTKYFIEKQEAENKLATTYYQIMSFCKMLSSQASNLAKTYLSVNHLSFIFGGVQNQLVKDFAAKIRSSLLEVLVYSALEFTTRSVFSSKSSQYQTIYELNKPENEIEINIQIQAAIANSIVSWEQSNHLTLLFDDGGKFTPVYRNFKQVSDNLRTIMISQNPSLAPDDDTLAKVLAQKDLNEYGGNEILRDYSKLTHKDLLSILKDIGNMQLTGDEEALASDDKLTDYVLTPDNFLKMALIMNRILANIPMVIMGETGCGKTSLVKYLATKVFKQKFESFNLHAGITEATFLKCMVRYIDRANDPELAKSNLWLFLDEFNTCDSIGLISEMICNGTLLGNPLPKNLRLIAACNPYRIKAVSIEVGLVQKKTSTRLIHVVHPLPHSLMDFVWDYGSLNQKEEKKYIVNMISTLRLDNEASSLLVEVISTAQEFIRKEEDSSSVSLRDVNRFKQVFSWFKKSLVNRPSPNWSPGKNKFSYWRKNVDLQDPKEFTLRAIVLAITHCYIYRFSMKKTRKLLIQKCVEVMKSSGWYLSEEKFKEICNDEQEDYLYRMNLPEGIALNSALKENVFMALVCILNKIPCFICGKPGCSKTLSVQLLSTNLRGVDSIEPFFRTLPEVYVITFQGSESSTSEAIEKTFEKARTLLAKPSKNRTILPLVVFDELGLAELSPHNPLKVLHSLLEPDKAEIAFVGISNWRLDASKMNRVVFLARPDPDKEDLELTAVSIYQSYSAQTNNENEDLMKFLTRAYYEYKKDVSKNKIFADFHGTRDFYYLIKYVTQEILSLESKTQDKILEKVKIGLERNFSGRDGSAKAIQTFFKNIYNKPDFNLDPIPVLDLIEHNLNDKTARYLMVITRGAASYILEKHFNKLIQNKITLVGSKFPADINTDEYSFRVLSEVILCVEIGWTLFMEGLNDIYGSLFDLFNQNFSIIGKRKNCRIALGSVVKPMCGVADDFRCILLVDESEVSKMEPPLLNRFEKYVLNFEDIMIPKQLELVERLKSWVEKLTTPKDEKSPNIPLESLLCNYKKESAYSLIFNYDADGKENDTKALLRKCKRDIIKTATSYLLLLAQNSVLQVEDPEEVEFFNDVYLDQKNPSSLKEAIISIISSSGRLIKVTQRLVVYTFDNILVNSEDSQQNMSYVTEVNLGIIYSEKELIDTIRNYLLSNKELLIIRADGVEHLKHISKLNFLINKLSASGLEDEGKLKHFCIIVHLPLNLIANDRGEGKACISYLAGWQQLTLDSLGYHPIELFKEIIKQSSQEIIKNEKIVKINKTTLIEAIEACLLKFKYNLITFQEDDDIVSYLDRLIIKLNGLHEDDKLWNLLRSKLLEGLTYMVIPDWKVELTTNKELLQKQYQPLDALKYWIKRQLDRPLSQILIQIEKDSAFESYFTNYEDKETAKLHQSIWLAVLQALKFDIKMKLQYINQSNEVNHLSGLKFAFSYREFKHIIDNDMEVALEKENATNIQRLFKEIKENEQLMKDFDLESEEERLEYQLKQETNMTKFTAALELCKNKTSYKDYFDTIVQSQSLRDKYIADVISIYTAERMKKSGKFAEFLNLLVRRLLTLEKTLYKVQVYYLLYKYESLFSKLTDILKLYEKIGDISNVADHLEGELPIEYNSNDGQEQWLLYVLDLLLQSIKPGKQLIDKIGGFNSFLAYFQTFIMLAFSIKTAIDLNPKNLEALQFWNDILLNIGFISDEKKKIQLFLDLHDATTDDESFLKSEEILVKLRSKIRAFCFEHEIDSPELIRLKTLLYMRYLKHNIGHEIILQDIIAHPKLMTQCGTLIDMYFSNLDVNKNLSFLKKGGNKILMILEEALSQSGTNSPLAALLSETIHQLIIWPELTTEEKIANFLGQSLDLWTEISINISGILQDPNFSHRNQIYFSNLYVVAGSSILKKILKIYSTAIIEPYQLTEKVHECFSRTLVEETGLFNTLRVFLAKCLNVKLGSVSKLKELLMKKDYLRKWGLKLQYGFCENVLDISAYPLKFKEKYRQVEDIVSNMLKSHMNDLDDFNKILNEASKSGTTKLCLLQAITNKVYLMQANKGFKLSTEFFSFSEWVSGNQDKIQAAMGNNTEAAKLIKLYCSNFEFEESLKFLKIDENTDIKNLKMISVKAFIINTVVALKDCAWPFTDLFFENGKLTKSFSQVLSKYYLIGLPESEKIDYLKDLVPLNFKSYTEDEINRGQWNSNLGCALYKCSDTCDYYYIVGGCTRVLENFQYKCWEGHLLGGSDYNQPHQRPGHQKIFQGEKEILMAIINKLRAAEPRGYGHKPVESYNYAPRNLQPIAYHILQYLLHEVMNFFYLTKMIDKEDEIRTALNIKNQTDIAKYLHRQVEASWKILSALLENTDDSNLYIVLNAIISGLTDLIVDDKFDTKTLEGRDKFEIKFQEKVATITQNLLAEINRFKRDFGRESKDKTSDIPMIQEIFEEGKFDHNKYPLQRLFRRTKELNNCKFRTDYLLKGEQLKKTNGFINLYFEKQEDLQKLKVLPPLLKFTNAAMSHYNHRITRNDATKEKKVKDFLGQNPSSKGSFEELMSLWNKHLSRDIQLGCKVYNKQRLTKESPLVLILPDSKKEQGSGILITAALCYLASIQNKFLDLAQGIAITNKNLLFLSQNDSTKFPLQIIRQDEIIPVKSDVIRIFQTFNFEYGKGEEINYDYDMIEYRLARELLVGKRFLNDNEEKIAKIHYHFELLNTQGDYSNLISELKRAVPQQSLTAQLEEMISEEIIYYLKDERDQKQGLQILKEIFSSVCLLLCFVKNSYRKELNTIGQCCQKINSSQLSNGFKKNEKFMAINLKYLVGFYEIIEMAMFDSILEIVPDSFKEELDEEALEAMNKFVIKLGKNELPTIGDLMIFIKKFIVRCLIADVEPDQQLLHYVSREDFWPGRVTDDMREKLSCEIPSLIKLCHAAGGFFKFVSERAEPPKPVKKEEIIRPIKPNPQGKSVQERAEERSQNRKKRNEI